MANAEPGSPSWGAALDRWFDALDAQGLRTGVRERLQVQALLARLAAAGELPATLEQTLALVAPLLCTTREQQRRYATLLQAFLAATPEVAAGEGSTRHPPAVRRSRRVLAAVCVAVAVSLAWLVWKGLQPAPAPVVEPPPVAPEVTPTPPPPSPPSAAAFYVPPASLPVQPALPPAWAPPLRAALVAIGALSALALAAAAFAARRRQLALQGLRTDDEIDHHFLRDVAPVDIAPHPVLARAVARALRQRVAGEARALDIGATLQATVAAHGAFSPRWQALRRTPEYLVLVDTRHACDHHAAYVHTLLAALQRAGVALHVFGYDTTPATGCWAHGAIGNDDVATRQRQPLATVAMRAGRSRLLVFGTADALLHPATGELQPWAASLQTLAERAWLTPMPLQAWGSAEQAADEAGFLVLPLQEAALPALAGWLTSRRATLALDIDTPKSWPTGLRGDGLEWVTRPDPPPREEIDDLVRQLRRMLGGVRFQWLCACAVYPALMPPLTLALGQHAIGDPRALALGMAALSALPWFRHGRMPAWLRRELLKHLTADLRGALDDEVQQRLAAALVDDSGPLLADIATRRRGLAAALSRRRGPMQDVVLADFVRAGIEPALAQRLPEALRRRLFRRGDPAAGVRPAWLAAPALAVGAALVALSPLWSDWVGTVPRPALAVLQDLALADAATAGAADLELMALGERLVAVRTAAKGLSAGALGAPADNLSTASFEDPQFRAGLAVLPTANAQGVRIELARGRLRLLSSDGTALGAALDTGGVAVTRAGFSASGSRVLGVLADGRLRVWGRAWEGDTVEVVACDDVDPAADPSGPLARRIAESPSRLGVVALQAALWKTLHPGDVAPATAAIDITSDLQRGLAQEIVGAASAAMPLSVNRVAAHADSGSALRVNACFTAALAANPAPLIPGLDTAAQAGLQARVEAALGPDAAARKSNTEALLKDPAALSDAVPLLVWRATPARDAAGPVDDSQASAVIDALILLQAAPPASLNRDRAAILALMAKVRTNGPKTSAQVDKLQQRVDAVASIRRPALSIQIAGAFQRPVAEALSRQLATTGFVVDGIEDIGQRAPAQPQLRVQGFSDRRIARGLRDAATTVLGMSMQVTSVDATSGNDTYEIWLDGALCATRVVAACQGAAPAIDGAPQSQVRKGAASTAAGTQEGLQLIAGFEGFTAARKPDATGSPFIGYGHAIGQQETDSGVIRIGDEQVPVAGPMTPAQGLRLLQADLAPTYAAVDSLITVPLSPQQRDALASFAFNVGARSAAFSALAGRLNAGDYNAVPDEMMKWTKIGGKEMPGLRNRRQAEVRLWQAGSAATKNPAATAAKK